MKFVTPVIPNENHREVILGEHQPEYENLPVIVLTDNQVVMRVEFTDEEIEKIKTSKSIYIYTHGIPFLPILVEVDKPNIQYPENN